MLCLPLTLCSAQGSEQAQADANSYAPVQPNADAQAHAAPVQPPVRLQLPHQPLAGVVADESVALRHRHRAHELCPRLLAIADAQTTARVQTTVLHLLLGGTVMIKETPLEVCLCAHCVSYAFCPCRLELKTSSNFT